MKANINIPKIPKTNMTREENIKYENMISKLESLGIYIRTYTNGINLFGIVHPDGVHKYMADALDAQTLLENNEELPQDLLDRLAYYKPIVDKMLKD